jgi:AraC family transcriptional regulator
MLVRTAADGMGIDPDRVAIRPHLHRRDPRIEHICQALAAELQSDEPFDRLYADSLGLALAAQLLRHYAPLVPPRISRGLSKRRLRKVTDYVGDNLAQDLTLSELAAVAGVSPSHFKMLFKLSMGMPVHQYVMRRRVQYAMALVMESTLPLSDVALTAGFANQSHMARCMRRFAGSTPGELRNSI